MVNSYPNHLAKILKRRRRFLVPHVIDLFAGCGGLSLGFESVGFRVTGYEKDANACATYRNNLNGDCHQVELDANFQFPPASVVIAGPPCQPFSVVGNQGGDRDVRNGLDIFLSAIDQVNPEIWMFENVRGLFLSSRDYFDALILRLTRMGYVVEYRLLNAKNFRVAQNRERIIVVGHRGGFRWPSSSSKIISAGMALGRLASSAPVTAKYVTKRMAKYIQKYERASCCASPRDLHLHLPARTLTCRNLAGATGDMHRLLLGDGRRRLLRPREAARLQGFPDWFNFSGSQASQFAQIGNAVPPLMAHALAKQFRDYLSRVDVI